MQLRIKILTFGAIFTLISLTVIQGYLINNTYQLKKKAIIFDARATVAKVYNTKKIDSLMWLYRNDFLIQLNDYKKGIIDKDQVLEKLKTKAKEVNSSFINEYSSAIDKNNQSYYIKFRKVATSIILRDSLNNIETFIEDKDPPLFLIGEDLYNDEAILINNSTWSKDHEFLIGNKKQLFFLDFKTQVFMSVENWGQKALKQMTGIMFLSSLLFLFVIGLLYYSIRNLIMQKRLADVKTDFINNITHELKTPLSTISIATKTLTNKYVQQNKEIAQDAIQVINRQNIRLQKLIDQVVDNSLGYKGITLTKEPIKMSVFLNNILTDYSLTITDEIAINKDIALSNEELNGDKFYLSTAIINILNNAIKYNGTKVSINYKVNSENNQHIISITDNGIGIPKKHQKFIFDKFYRVNEKDTHNYKGLGLGLYYSSQIVKAHNGTIELITKEKIGSTFIMKIPMS